MVDFRRLQGPAGEALSSELQALAAERDPELYFQDLNKLGRRLADRGRSEEAKRIFSFAAKEALTCDPQSARRAVEELAVLSGGGSFGRRVEFTVRSIITEALSPAALTSMAVAGGVYSLARGAILGRLVLSGARPLTRNFGARAISGLGAFVLEAPAFTATLRAIQNLRGTKPSNTFAADIVASYASLGGLRLFGCLGGLAARRFEFHPLVGRLASRSGSLLGIFAGQSLERKISGLPALSLDQSLFHSLATFAQFGVGGRFLVAALGRGWVRGQREIHAREEGAIASPPRSSLSPSTPSLPLKISAWGALLCTGCSGTSSEILPLILGIGTATALTWGYHRRSVARARAIDRFHSLPKKTVEDLRIAISRGTGLPAQEIDQVIQTTLRYGAPPFGSSVSKKGPFKAVAVEVLRLPPIKRRGGIPYTVLHHVPDPLDTKRSVSHISGMPLAYADRIRSWARQNLEVPAEWRATVEQIADRQDILTTKVALKFRLPMETSGRLVDLLLRNSFVKPGEQKGQLFKDEFPALLADDASLEYHQRLNLQPAEVLLRQAGLGDRSIPWLKQVITQLAADCRIPIPGYSMNPRDPLNKARIYGNFTDHDWHAVFRLRDAVAGPWRLPWEEIPRLEPNLPLE